VEGVVTERLAEALWYVGPGRAEIKQESLPARRQSEVRVRALYGGLSRGTERLVFSGKVPASEYERMRGPAMGGNFPFPIKYGYASVGVVEDGSPDLVGKTVFALHPHQTAFSIDASAVVAVPESVPASRAVLAANMETALNAIWDAAPGPGDRIAVVGAGTVGALCAWLAGRFPGSEVTLVDTNDARAKIAAALRVSFARPRAAPTDCDLVIHASGTAEGLATALDCAGDEATVLELSWYGANQVAAPLGGPFHSRRLQLKSSQVGQVAPSHRTRWTHRRRLMKALELLTDPTLDALLAPAVTFHDLPARLPDILGPASGVLCQLIRYPAADAAR
jgi:NADPH:quinone reductase-like Zn-dependent oxidoreductase